MNETEPGMHREHPFGQKKQRVTVVEVLDSLLVRAFTCQDGQNGSVASVEIEI